MVNPKQDPEGVAFVPVASVEELGQGERLLLEVAGYTIALFNLAGQYHAIADVCSHDDGPVAAGDVDEHEIACPRHGARFDLRTGKALSLPAVVDIPTYPVRVKGDQIEVGIPKP
ncbi:MAG: non-heme iron oxygenase ferredoxin subunit [Anaerolineales bacterium]|jgi:3-phenylpropionate/trans-cinnamate dioxygenase ferredoxin subunit